LGFPPSQETLVSPKRHIDSRINDVVGRATDPPCVLVGSAATRSSNWYLRSTIGGGLVMTGISPPYLYDGLECEFELPFTEPVTER
jgi:hypothetical protein